ncbi:DUF418 domain-containing protein [Paenibacillus sp. 481]|uniref:DUF418 domain-containing protein n=1 Tax=Paenibacillus sp. 481 TaxID=2835869 RepID=UPI001E554724|nr:DUF418 domain-containing protein [Paenibacillus sp. 481]UHA73146.1 DUF418 domain-containing protein [Paenibacillus sp. 481]
MDSERLHLLDGIRGFALLGILLVHMPAFQYSFNFEPDEKMPWLEQLSLHFVHIFADSSFLPLFAFMFGASVILLKRSLEKKGLNTKIVFVRRFLFLAGLGAIHGVVLWEGDILLPYSVAAFLVLVLFLHCKPLTCLLWGIGLWLGPVLVSLVLRPLGWITSSYVNVMDLLYLVILPSPAEWLLELIYNWADALPMFLIGMYIFQTKLFTHAVEQQQRNRYLAIFCLAIGLPLKALSHVAYLPLGDDLLSISNILVTLGYLFGIVYAYTTSIGRKWFRPFEFVGKMSLTNYLTHTIVFTLIFIPAGHLFAGVGIVQEIGMFWGTVVAFITIGLQALFSAWWLSKFSYGPVEWIWRLWTYWKWSPISKSDFAHDVKHADHRKPTALTQHSERKHKKSSAL